MTGHVGGLTQVIQDTVLDASSTCSKCRAANRKCIPIGTPGGPSKQQLIGQIDVLKYENECLKEKIARLEALEAGDNIDYGE
jgi:hypothetical protein